MSYTPQFLIEKESFDKAFEKISTRVRNYWSDRNEFFSWFDNAIKLKKREYEELVRECGSTPNEEVLKKKAEEEIKKSKEYKEKEKNLLRDDPLSDVLEYYDEKSDFEIKDNKYYLFETEYSSQAEQLKEFCEDNGVIFAVSY